MHAVNLEDLFELMFQPAFRGDACDAGFQLVVHLGELLVVRATQVDRQRQPAHPALGRGADPGHLHQAVPHAVGVDSQFGRG